ncbi:hypothetical protein ACPW96_02210 [Micromonospora sp. DT81.3]
MLVAALVAVLGIVLDGRRSTAAPAAPAEEGPGGARPASVPRQ